jgi:hypothetical protein
LIGGNPGFVGGGAHISYVATAGAPSGGGAIAGTADGVIPGMTESVPSRPATLAATRRRRDRSMLRPTRAALKASTLEPTAPTKYQIFFESPGRSDEPPAASF